MAIASDNTRFFSGNPSTVEGILKFIQKSGTKVLWVNKNAFDAVTKKESWPGGKQITYSLTTSAGGGGMSGMASTNGTFAPIDFAQSIVGHINAKFQTFSMGYDIMSEEMSKSEQAAYISHRKRLYAGQIDLQRTELAVQKLGDGTGRKATPVGIGSTSVNSGASFTHTENTPLPIKIGSGLNVVGSIAHLYEDAVVSFIFASYDENDDGTLELNESNCVPRYLNLHFDNGSTSETYEAFRVVRYDQWSNTVYVVPGRKQTSGSAATQDYTVQRYWVADNNATLTVTFRRGRTFDGTGASSSSNITDLSNVFNPTGKTRAVYLIHPEYVPTGSVTFGQPNLVFSAYSTTTRTATEVGRLLLGLGWTPDTDVSLISPYVPTGFDTLLRNYSNRVHGIPRSQVIQMLPTHHDGAGRTLDYTMLLQFITNHILRNEDKLPEWNVIFMNSLVYAHFESLFMREMKVETTEKGIGGFPAHYIIVRGKKFQLEGHSSVRHDTIFCIPNQFITQMGMELKQVEIAGQTSFPAFDSTGRNMMRYAERTFYRTYGELFCENLRAAAFLDNFVIS